MCCLTWLLQGGSCYWFFLSQGNQIKQHELWWLTRNSTHYFPGIPPHEQYSKLKDHDLGVVMSLTMWIPNHLWDVGHNLHIDVTNFPAVLPYGDNVSPRKQLCMMLVWPEHNTYIYRTFFTFWLVKQNKTQQISCHYHLLYSLGHKLALPSSSLTKN